MKAYRALFISHVCRFEQAPEAVRYAVTADDCSDDFSRHDGTWIFFQSMRGTHRAIVAEKQREIGYVRRWMASTYQRLHARAEDLDELQRSTAELRAWLALEQRLLAVPEWPYDTRILRSLVISILVPIISVLARLAMERLY